MRRPLARRKANRHGARKLDRDCVDVSSGQRVFTLKGHKGWIWKVAFSPDGKRIVTAGDDATAILWDVVTGRELLTLRGHDWIIRGLAFSPDGSRILTGSQDGTARVWDAGQFTQQR